MEWFIDLTENDEQQSKPESTKKDAPPESANWKPLADSSLDVSTESSIGDEDSSNEEPATQAGSGDQPIQF